PLSEPIPDLVAKIIQYPRLNAGYDLERGLFGLRAQTREKNDPNKEMDSGVMSIPQAAHRLNVHHAVVRSLVIHDYLTASKQEGWSRTMQLLVSEVDAFNEQYVFAGVL